jgi:integrase
MKRVIVKNIRNKAVLYYTNSNKIFRKSTGVSISKSDFTSKGVIKDAFFKKNSEIITRLNYLNEIIDEYFIKNKTLPSVNYLISIIDDDITEHDKKSTSFISHYEVFFNEKKKYFENDESKSINSLRDFRSTWNSLIDFELEKDRTLLLSDINEGWVNNDYFFFMKEKRKSTNQKRFKTKGNLKNNSLKKRYDCLFMFFKWLKKKDLIAEICDRRNLGQVDVDKIAISTKEVMQLHNFQSKDDILNEIKDYFIFACLTGFRFSDLKLLKAHHFVQKNDFWVVSKRTEKTKILCEIPLCTVAQKIMERYSFKFKIPTNQHYNRCIKEVAKESKLFDGDGVKDGQMFKRWELLSSHTSRTSFITNLIDSNEVSISVLMSYTGHIKLETVQKYLVLKKPESSTIINKVFNPNI